MPNQELGKQREGFVELPGFKKGGVRDIRGPRRERDAPGGKPRNLTARPSRQNRTAGLARVPQAVVKVTGYSKGTHKHVAEHVNYITKNGKWALEGEDGKVRQGKKVATELLEDWGEKQLGKPEEKAFKNGQSPRKAAHLMLSSPEGTSGEKLREIARDFLHREFGEKTKYAFAIHENTKNTHVHVVLAMRGYDGKKLRLGKPEIQALREGFAEVATEHGLPLSASRRVDRGLDEGKPSARNNAEYRREQRGEASQEFRGSIELAYRELTGQRGEETKGEKRHSNKVEDAREAAAEDANFYGDQAGKQPEKAAALRRIAELHAGIAWSTEAPKSVREQFRELVAAAADGKEDHPLDRGKKGEPTAGMRVLIETIAKEKGLDVPDGYASDFGVARAFLNEHAKREINSGKVRRNDAGRENEGAERE